MDDLLDSRKFVTPPIDVKTRIILNLFKKHELEIYMYTNHRAKEN